MGGPVSFSSSLLCTGAPKAREGRAHPQGAQPRPRPGLLAWRLYAGVRFRPRRRWQQVTDPPTVAAMAERWAAGGWPCQTDETGRAITAETAGPQPDRRLGSSTHHTVVGDCAVDHRARRCNPVAISKLSRYREAVSAAQDRTDPEGKRRRPSLELGRGDRSP